MCERAKRVELRPTRMRKVPDSPIPVGALSSDVSFCEMGHRASQADRAGAAHFMRTSLAWLRPMVWWYHGAMTTARVSGTGSNRARAQPYAWPPCRPPNLHAQSVNSLRFTSDASGVLNIVNLTTSSLCCWPSTPSTAQYCSCGTRQRTKACAARRPGELKGEQDPP